jgi:hypothetical protein
MDLILAEQLLLLLLDDEKGSDQSYWGKDPGLAGAVLLDLATTGAVQQHDGKLAAAPDRTPEHPVLAAAHAAIAQSDKPRDAKGWVGRLPKELEPMDQRIAERLVEGGVLEEQRRKLLGLFEQTRFPEADPAPERDLRERLRAVLMAERQPTGDEALLVALLIPYDQVKRLVPKEHRKAANRRAKEIADHGIAGKAVADTIEGIQVAVMVAATTAASSAAVAGGN